MNSSAFKPIALFATAAFLAVAFIGLKYLKAKCVPSEVAKLKKDISELPKVLGDHQKWKGSDSELNEEIFEAVDAQTIVNRNYKNTLGNTISLHMPMFLEHTVFTPHNPRHCYKGAGFEILDDDVLNLPIDSKTSIKVRFMTLERGTEHIQVLFWYQIGDRVVTGDGGMRRARWDERWHKTRSPVIKVLLQTANQNVSLGESQLRSLAIPIYEWLREVQTTESSPATEEVEVEVNADEADDTQNTKAEAGEAETSKTEESAAGTAEASA